MPEVNDNEGRRERDDIPKNDNKAKPGVTHDGLPVPGYKPQSSEAVAMVTSMKQMEEGVLRALDALKVDPNTDQRWLAIGRTAIEQGFMAVNRSVFKPDRVKLPDDTAGTPARIAEEKRRPSLPA